MRTASVLADREAGVPRGIVAALGVTQIIGYGTLYYSFGILAPAMATTIGWSREGIFALFSAGLLIGGIVAPFAGRAMDRFGAARLMALGSALSAATLAACALADRPLTFGLAVMAMEIASAFVLYQAAFAALVEIDPHRAGRSITWLTLIAGFASTLFWPLTTALHAHVTWQTVYGLFALANLALCLPLHLWIGRRAGLHRRHDRGSSPSVEGRLAEAARRRGFVLATAGFAFLGFSLSAMLVHMVPMLTALGLGGSAVLVATVFGPAQVLSRLVNMLFGSRLTPVMLAALSAAAISAGIGLLLAFGAFLPGAVLFALFLGLGSGINSIAQGALPLYLFGSEGYGALTGRMAAARLAAGAAAPFAFAALTDRLGSAAALATAEALGLLSVACFLALGSGRTGNG
jgi:hypothetical protein